MPTQKEVWNQIDHRLVSLKLQPLAHQRERETDKKQAEIYHSNPGATAKAYKLFELEIEQMRKCPEAVYPVYKEVWQKQGKKITSHFVRAVFHKGIVPVIETRKESSREFLTNHATQTGMSRSLLGPQVQELEREAARLIAEWRRRTEIEALEIEHERKSLRNTSARAMAEKERKEAQPVRPITKAPKPLTPLSGRGMLRGPKPTQMPLDWPPYYPNNLIPLTTVIIGEALKKFPVQTQTLPLCKYVISRLTPHLCAAVQRKILRADLALSRMSELLHYLSVSNCDDSEASFRLEQETMRSDEWLKLAGEIARVPSAAANDSSYTHLEAEKPETKEGALKSRRGRKRGKRLRDTVALDNAIRSAKEELSRESDSPPGTDEIARILANRARIPLPRGWRRKYGARSWKDVLGIRKLLHLASKRFTKVKLRSL